MNKFEKVYVLDTNIILNNANSIFNISQENENLIVLPETVIDELDGKKSGFEEINFQAREFARILSEAEVIKTSKLGKNKDITIMRVLAREITIDIISFNNYELENVEKNILNDRKIIKVASFAKNYYKQSEVILLSDDVMCRTRAISLNVKTENLTNNNEDSTFEFIKEFNIESTLLNTLSNKDIRLIDPEYSKENYCYIFNSETGHKVLGVIINERINIVDENELRKHTVKPKNVGQLFAYYGMIDERFNICLIDALAGSGKTLLAVAAGMRCIDKGKYNKIVYVRNSIESVDKGEDVGYLSGNDEKFRIYNMPLYDTIEFIARAGIKDNKQIDSESIDEKIDELKNKYNIETCWVGEMRGRTLSNAFVIVDEGQNMSDKTMQLVLSRLDENCKVIVIGSNKQIDNMFVNKYTNGLSTLLKSSKEEHTEVNIFATKLDKVVRGRITQFAEKIFGQKILRRN